MSKLGTTVTDVVGELEPLARKWSELRPGGARLVRVIPSRDLR